MPQKERTKTSVLETKCVSSDGGPWTWEAGGLTWHWYDDRPAGINLTVKNQSGDETGVLFARKLDEAVMFSQGWVAGEQYGKTQR